VVEAFIQEEGAHYFVFLPAELGISALVLLTHVPTGLVAAAMILVFRTAGPLTAAVMVSSTLLGGGFHFNTVIPESARPLSAVVSLTYGPRALRQTLLGTDGPATVVRDAAILAPFAVGLVAVGAFTWALRHARKAGSLGQL
jgi:ABC-type polysaccharide/polyol phosphate export permease